MTNQNENLAFVFTAYTLHEADDDFEVIKKLVDKYQTSNIASTASGAYCMWEPSLNIFASKVQRETISAPPGRIYRENAAWQCWQFNSQQSA
jgi:hypothetical protein